MKWPQSNVLSYMHTLRFHTNTQDCLCGTPNIIFIIQEGIEEKVYQYISIAWNILVRK